MRLHPYQSAAIAKYVEAHRAGARKILFVGPTGMGKTVLGSYLNRAADRQGKRACWFVPRRELVHQTARMLSRFGVTAGHSGQSLTAPTQLRTYQGSLASGEVPPFDVGFVDEAHHLSGGGEWVSVMRACPDATLIGFSATPERADGRGLDDFEALVTVCQPEDLVALWRESGGAMGLVPCEVLRPNRHLDGLARSPAKATILHRLKDHQQVVFAPHVLAAEQYVAEFRGIGSTCEMVTGTTAKEDRDRIVADFAARRTRVLVNCMVLTEGTDIPAIEVVTLARNVGSIGALIQMVGRGARPCEGKTRFVVLDLFGCTHTLGHPFMDRTYSLQGRGISGPPVERVLLRLCKRCSAQMPDDDDKCATPGCGWRRPALEVPRSLEEKLEKWEHRRQDQTDERVTRMAGWIRAAQRRGQHKKATAIAIHTYQGWYREPPTRAVISHAVAVASGKTWCARCEHGTCRCAVASGLTGT